MNVIVIAKSPMPGRSKTRLCPPLTPPEAAAVAEAALADTLDAVARCGAERRILALAGLPGPWLPSGFRIVDQRGRGLDERIANAFEDAGGPALLVGMDTPQVSPRLLDDCMALASARAVDVGLGLAVDGGWWALAQQAPDPRVLLGIPMSRRSTGAMQFVRILELDLRCAILPALRDVDRFEDALAVAADAPGTRFASWVRRWSDRHGARSSPNAQPASVGGRLA